MRVRHRVITNRTTERPTVGTRPNKAVSRTVSSKSWYRIENHRQSSNATIYIYDEIGFWGITASEFVTELDNVDAKHIDVHINSPGGDVFDGIAIYNALANHTASVTTYIDGLAASAASFIAQAGTPVKIARNGSMMIHDAEGICMGNCAAMLEMADLLDAASNNIADIYAQSGGTISQWRDRMKDTTWYHNGQDAVDAGLADEVYEPDQDDQVDGDDNQDGDGGDDEGDDGEGEGDGEGADALDDAVDVDSGAVDAFEFDAAMLVGAFSTALTEADAPPFDVEQFRLTMATVASNCPAVATDPPRVPELPPMPPPDLTARCECGRPVEHMATDGELVIDPATMRHIMTDAANNAPAPVDSPVVPVGVSDPPIAIDRAVFQAAIKRGLL